MALEIALAQEYSSLEEGIFGDKLNLKMICVPSFFCFSPQFSKLAKQLLKLAKIIVHDFLSQPQIQESIFLNHIYNVILWQLKNE